MASRRILDAVSGANTYLVANPLRSDERKRTKDSTATVRRLYLDFDVEGEPRLTSLRTSDTVPTPTAVLSISLRKYQILGRIDSFNFEQPESTLKLPAIPFGRDPACMDCNRVLRMPGFRNDKNDASYPITVKYPCDSTSNPGDFRLDIPAANALPLPHAISSRKHPAKHTIPNTIGRGFYTNLPTEKTPRSWRERFLPAALITPVASARLCSTKAFRWRTFVTLLAVRHCSEIASARCIREGPSKDSGGADAKKPTAGVESTVSVRVLKACSCIQFRGNAETVLRTGRISTLHPFEGAAQRFGALQSDLFRMNNLQFRGRFRASQVHLLKRGSYDRRIHFCKEEQITKFPYSHC